MLQVRVNREGDDRQADLTQPMGFLMNSEVKPKGQAITVKSEE